MADVLNRSTMTFIKSVNTPDYDPAEWLINPDLSAVAGVPVKYWKIDANDNVVEMTQAEKDAVDSSLLPSVQQELIKQIDAEAENRIHNGQGFEWPPTSGQYFSLSANAQTKWVGLMVSKDFLTYPLVVPTSDDNVFYSVADATEAQNMYLTASDTIKTLLGEATTAKQNVKAATTIADAQAAADAYLNS